MDHSRAPFTPPGHRQGAGADPRVREVFGGALAADILAAPGLDDRLSRGGYRVSR